MKNAMTIVRKEFARFFGDWRLALSTLLLPGLMIFGIYWLIGEGMNSIGVEDDDVVYDIAVYNMPEDFGVVLQSIIAATDFPSMDFRTVTNIDTARERMEDGYYDLLVAFPSDFSANPDALGTDPQEVTLYFDSTTQSSSLASHTFAGLLNAHHAVVLPAPTLFAPAFYDIADDAAVAGMVLSMMLPMLIILFLFQSCMALTPESIAGEKERGTIASMLVTPIKRSEFAAGKVISLSVISLLAGISSFIGIMAAMPMMLGDGIEMGEAASAYSMTDYVWLLVLVLATVILIVALMSLISAFAKSVKEATGILTPVAMVGMVAGFATMFGGNSQEIYWFLIPFYNTALSLVGIFAFDYSVTNIAITIATNLVLAFVLMFVLTKMFNSEKVMFKK